MNLWYCRQETEDRLRSCIVRLDCRRIPANPRDYKEEVLKVAEELRQVRVKVEQIARADFLFDSVEPIDIRMLGELESSQRSWHLENLILKDSDPGPAGGPFR